MTRILGIETSCDETSAAVLTGSGDDVAVESLVILSQDVHRLFGGVVPEIASRHHLTAIVPVVRQALADAKVEMGDVDAVAVTNAPGLVGALLVGVSFAKALAFGCGIPSVGVHHMEGHLFATALEHRNAVPPFTALLVSGGHTLIVDVDAWGTYRLLGRTRDDAAGEAFDKVAKLLGLGFPGGPAIERLALEGNPAAFDFPRPMLHLPGCDFSFSGLKTAVVLAVAARGPAPWPGTWIADVAASFQAAVLDTLAVKTRRALEQTGARALTLGGGVACNRALCSRLAAECAPLGVALRVPSPRLCADNAAMIAHLGARLLARGIPSADLRVVASLEESGLPADND